MQATQSSVAARGDGASSDGLEPLEGWGHCPVVRGVERLGEDLAEIVDGACLSRGLGRSYGDASLPPFPGGVVAGTRLADRLLAFDPATRVLRAESGLPLAELNRLFWPRGFASPVSPGTKQVTLGGMVASDVHGKNHHRAGCFGEHVRALRMRVADGRVLEASEREHPDLFRATFGGMGLMGHVLEVEFVLEAIPSPWIFRESRRAGDLDALLAALREASARWPFTVAWLDAAAPGRSFGRGIVEAGRWATADEAGSRLPPTPRALAVPFRMPRGLLSRPIVRVLDQAWWMRHGRAPRSGVVDPDSFFYPLDALRHWNRLYGPSGFSQYQCVLPVDAARDAIAAILQALRAAGACAPLVVVKDCGPEGRGMLSFPRPGVSIALDVPVRRDQTAALIARWNAMTAEAGGRMYLAKDAFTTREQFVAMEPRLGAFDAVRDAWDPGRKLRSALSTRLFGDPA